MKKLLTALALSLNFLFFFKTTPVRAEFLNVAGTSAVPKNRLTIEKKDLRVEKLEKFLLEKKSPLAEYAACFIETADKYQFNEYDLDYLVPAITGLESSFGKRYPQGSYNAYGWAGGSYRFPSWENSIEHVSRVLKENYINRGADTIYKIGPIYAESPTWAQRVAFLKKQIESFNPEPSLTI